MCMENTFLSGEQLAQKKNAFENFQKIFLQE